MLSATAFGPDKQAMATDVIEDAGLDPDWFPLPYQSGKVLDPIRTLSSQNPWHRVCGYPAGMEYAGRPGDNHASAVGCGLNDFSTIVLLRQQRNQCPAMLARAKLEGKAARFEYFRNQLLLNMLAAARSGITDLQRNCRNRRYDDGCELDARAFHADMRELCFVKQVASGNRWREVYPSAWKT